MGKRRTPEEMRADEIKELRKKVAALQKEQQQKHDIAEEKAEVKRLMRQVHPTRLQRLTGKIAKRPHVSEQEKKNIIGALRGLKKAGHELNKYRKALRKHGQEKYGG